MSPPSFPRGPLLEKYVCFHLVCMCTPPSPKVLTVGNLLPAVFRHGEVEIMWKKQTWYNLPKVNSLKRQMGLPNCTVPAPRALSYQSVVHFFLPVFLVEIKSLMNSQSQGRRVETLFTSKFPHVLDRDSLRPVLLFHYRKTNVSTCC